MRRILAALALLLVFPALAQESASYKLTEHAFNAGGNPSNGSLLTSASYKITIDAIGDNVADLGMFSSSYRLDGGFVAAYPPPGEVQGLRFTDLETLAWDPERSIGLYHLYRDEVDNLTGLGYGTCLPPAPLDSTATDAEVPLANEGFFYLVTAENKLEEEGTKERTARELNGRTMIPVPDHGGYEMTKQTALVLSVFLFVGTGYAQGNPPGLINYQGVLRDADDNPLSGTTDMVFQFFDADGGAPPCPASGGTLLLTDGHLASGSGGVTVAGGLFNVALGSGELSAGTVSSLAGVFRNRGEVYLEVVVEGETLCPRTRVLSAAYAVNAARASEGELDLYVNGSSGDDNNDGLTPSTAKATIMGAVRAIPSVLNDDANINISPGTYNEEILLSQRLRNGPYFLRLRNATNDPSLVRIEPPLDPGETVIGFGIFVMDEVVSIEALTIDGFSNAGVGAGAGGFLNLSNCVLSNNNEGVQASGGHEVQLSEGCQILSNGEGIHADERGDVVVVGSISFCDNLESTQALRNSTIQFEIDPGDTCTFCAGDPGMATSKFGIIEGFAACTGVTCTPTDADGRCHP